MVAAQAHQKGSMKSASSPSNMKTIQNIFFCIVAILIDWQTELIRSFYISWTRRVCGTLES
jgi:hypothetical protein